MPRRRTCSSSTPGAGRRYPSPGLLAATRSPVTSSAAGRPSARSTSASGSATRRRPSSSTGRPISARSAATRTSRSGRPELEGPVGPVGDQTVQPAAGDKAPHETHVVDGPDPDVDSVLLAEAERLVGHVLLIEAEEVGVGLLDPPAREPGQDLGKLLLDRADRFMVLRRD